MSAFAVCAYTYAGYPALVWLLNRLRRADAPPAPPDPSPSVRMLVAAHDEQRTIGRLLRSCAALDYPRGALAVTVVLDACSDGTAVLVEGERRAIEAAGVALTVIDSAVRRGKGGSLALAVARCDEPVLVFTDANVVLDHGAVRALVRWFGREDVGAVAGCRRPLADTAGLPGHGDRLYWACEAAIKCWEATLVSVAGADGALYAVRRELFIPPAGCADDLEISLAVMAAGRRVAYAEDALARESAAPRLRDEFQRKLRTQSCAIDAFWRFRGLLSPRRPATAWILISHKLLRYAVPYCALGLGLAGLQFGSSRYLRRGVGALVAGATTTALAPGPMRAPARRVLAVAAYALLAQAAAALAPFTLLLPRRGFWRPTPR